MAICSSRLLSVTFFLVTLCFSTIASAQYPVAKDGVETKSLGSPVNGHFRRLRRRANQQHLQEDLQTLWKRPNLQYSAAYDGVLGVSDTSTAPITYGTTSPVVHQKSAPTAAPTKSPSEIPSLAPTLNSTDSPTGESTAKPTKSPTLPPSGVPSFSPTTVGSMNSSVLGGASSKLSKIIFLSTFLGVYLLLGGGIAIRWRWNR